MTTPDLRPCPFCGGHASFRELETMNVGLSFPEHYVQCDECGASGPVGGSLKKGKYEAATKWNWRTK